MPSDAEITRMVQREIGRRNVDASRIDIRVIHGMVYVRGTLRHLRTHPEVNLEQEAEILRKTLRLRPGIRGVVWEAENAD